MRSAAAARCASFCAVLSEVKPRDEREEARLARSDAGPVERGGLGEWVRAGDDPADDPEIRPERRLECEERALPVADATEKARPDLVPERTDPPVDLQHKTRDIN
jgi:hypothetical protein